MEAPTAQLLSDLTRAALGEVEFAYQNGDHGLDTGIFELDNVLYPFTSGSLTLIASGRGGGRTTLALQLALAAGPAVYLSTGLRANDVALRTLGMQAAAHGRDLRRGRVSERVWGRIGTALHRIDNLPIIVVVDHIADFSHVRSGLDRADREPARTIVFDGIDLDTTLASDSRVAALHEVRDLTETHPAAAWVVTVGLSCADYAPTHGEAFDAFLDIVPTWVDRVLWFDNDRSLAVRRLEVYDHNAPSDSITLTMPRGVPRFYGMTEFADTRGDEPEPSPDLAPV